jgi:hypothetical protein
METIRAGKRALSPSFRYGERAAARERLPTAGSHVINKESFKIVAIKHFQTMRNPPQGRTTRQIGTDGLFPPP